MHKIVNRVWNFNDGVYVDIFDYMANRTRRFAYKDWVIERMAEANNIRVKYWCQSRDVLFADSKLRYSS